MYSFGQLKQSWRKVVFLGLFSALAASSVLAAPSISQAQKDSFLKLPEAQQRAMVSQLPDAQKKSLFLSLSASEQQKLLGKLSVAERKLVSGSVTAPASTSAAAPVSTAARAPKVESAPSTVEKAAQAVSKQASLSESTPPKIAYPALKQFGYSLFEGAPTTFAPTADIPIPNEYIVGPGDEINVLLFGKENTEFSLTVTREGEINFPRIGPMTVSGLTFKELRELIDLRVSKQTIGVKVNITLGALRSIRVFVLGDVNRPGSYTISALSTLTNALFVSGGIKPIGTLRDIELKRKGKVVANFDLYDLLLNGDTSNDVRLLPGDVIFVKPLGKTVGIGGEVRRPAIYELGPQEKSVGDLLNYSGGMLPTAFPKVSQIERISENGQRTLVELDLSRKASLSEPILDGDTVRIFSILDRMNDIVMVSGHVRRPGGTEWRPGLRVQDVLKSMDELKSGADTDYGLIRREDAPNGHISVISVDLAEAIKDPFGPENVLLSPRDQLMVFSNNQSRAPVIKGLINELNLQARFNQPALVVRIAGNVRFPGNYPYVPDMRISDLVQASLDVLPETDMQYALVKREHPKENRIEVFSIALSDSLGSKGQNHDIKLQPSDEVTVFRLTQDRPPLIAGIVSKLRDNARFGQPEPVVSIIGNVRYPGNYPLESNMRLSDLIRASLDVLPATDMQYAILRRESNNRDHITLLPLSLYKAMSPVAEEDDPMLQPRDQLIVLSLKDNRSAIISQYIAELRQQARSGEPEPTVTIKGNAKHPGDYPLGPNMRVSDLVSASLGVLPATDMQYAIIRRESDNREEISLLPLSLSKAMNPAVEEDDPVLQPRDQLIVLSINDNRNELISQYINELRLQARYEQPEAVVSIMGNVRYPGDYPLGANMRVSDLISASLNLLPETDMQYALLERIEADDTTTILPVSLMAALSAPDSASNMALRMKDSLIVFNKTGDRQQAMGEILSDLKGQAILGQPARVVSINGRVKQAGSYPLTQGMRISDIVLASGGLTEAAYSMVAEITRFSVGQDSGFYTSHSTVNLGKAVAGDLSENKLLEPHDILTVKQAPDWLEQKSVSITGEVKFPGTYPITKGETLAQLLARAGGVTDLGEPVAAIFSRKALRSREAKAKDKLILDLEMDAALIQKDLASQATIDPQKMEKSTVAIGSMTKVIDQIKQSEELGRLVIDLPSIVANTTEDILLKDGDKLHIPQIVQEVGITGEIMNPSSMLYSPSMTLKDYIEASGGLTSQADTKRIYVIKANGSIVTANSTTKTLFNGHTTMIDPGDMIMVPMDLEHVSALTKWTNISQISYQFAITAASIMALGIF